MTVVLLLSRPEANVFEQENPGDVSMILPRMMDRIGNETDRRADRATEDSSQRPERERRHAPAAGSAQMRDHADFPAVTEKESDRGHMLPDAKVVENPPSRAADVKISAEQHALPADSTG